MLKHIALRLRKPHDARIAFTIRKTTIINSALEKRDPALRNLTEGLYANGLEFEVDDCRLYWFQIDDEKTVEFYLSFNEVECAFTSSWLEEQKARFRYMAGIKYYDASSGLAKIFDVKNQSRSIAYDTHIKAA